MSSRRSSLITLITRKSFLFDNDSPDHSEESSMVEGPGAISGRWIEALGKLTLGRYEQLVIQRRLLLIKTRLPHQDEEHVPTYMYDDLLELSRLLEFELLNPFHV